MRSLLLKIIGSTLGFWLAAELIPGVTLVGGGKALVLTGLALGLANFFLKPILAIVSFPLKILTFGLFGLVLNVLMVWLIDFLLPELTLSGLTALLGTTFFVWLANSLVQKWI